MAATLILGLSAIVPTPVTLSDPASVIPAADEMLRLSVSAPSSSPSLVMSTATVFEVSPDWNSMLPVRAT